MTTFRFKPIFSAPFTACAFEGAWRRASTMTIGGHDLQVLSLEDIVKSKTAANRPKDRAVLLTLKATLDASRTKKEKR